MQQNPNLSQLRRNWPRAHIGAPQNRRPRQNRGPPPPFEHAGTLPVSSVAKPPRWTLSTSCSPKSSRCRKRDSAVPYPWRDQRSLTRNQKAARNVYLPKKRIAKPAGFLGMRLPERRQEIVMKQGLTKSRLTPPARSRPTPPAFPRAELCRAFGLAAVAAELNLRMRCWSPRWPRRSGWEPQH